MLNSEIMECLNKGFEFNITPFEYNNEKYKISAKNGKVTLFSAYKGFEFAICDIKPLLDFYKCDNEYIEALIVEMVNNGKAGNLEKYVATSNNIYNAMDYKEFLNKILENGIESTFKQWLFWKRYNGVDYHIFCYSTIDKDKKFWLNFAENPLQSHNRIYCINAEYLLDYAFDCEKFYRKLDLKCVNYFHKKSLSTKKADIENFIN